MTAALAAATLALLAGGSGTALAAGPGETFLVGGLPLPAGAIAGGDAGLLDDDPDRTAISDDGRYVAFSAAADTLSPDAALDVVNVYRKDRVTGEVVLVSRASGAAGAGGSGQSGSPAISDDGSRVGFATSSRLDPADGDDDWDVYVRDVATATTIPITVGVAGGVSSFDLSGNGRWVAFPTAARLVAGDGNAFPDVYRRAVGGGATTLVSKRAGAVTAGNGGSFAPSISDDGRWVAFQSSATDLVSGYAGGGDQVFARDVTLDTSTTLVSNASGLPRTAASGSAGEPDVAGRPGATLTDVIVAFSSSGTNLTADDGDSVASVYRHRLSDLSATLVSRATGALGANASSRAHTPSISDDGARVAFASDAPNLGAGADYYGVYVRDAGASTTVLGSAHNNYAVQAALAGDGGALAWFENASAAPGGDPDLSGVLVRSYATPPASLGGVELASRPPGSAPYLSPVARLFQNEPGQQAISADGRYVVFTSLAARLPAGGDSAYRVYRRDTLTGEVVLVSRADGPDGAPGASYSVLPSISADGSRVVFASYDRFDPADAGGGAYVRDLAAGTTRLLSRADGAGGAAADRAANQPRISADGRYATFESAATNLGAAGTVTHVYRRGIDDGSTVVVDRADGQAGAIGNGDADSAQPSRDGERILFQTLATNLSGDDTARRDRDLYLRDLASGSTTLVSRRNGLAGAKTTEAVGAAVLSADGRVAVFRSEDEALAPEAGGWGGRYEIVARDLAGGANALVSRVPGGAPANQSADEPAVSADGGVIAFSSEATNLVAGLGGDDRTAVFARQTATGALSGPPQFGVAGAEDRFGASGPALSADGQCMFFTANGHNAVSGNAGDVETGYVHVVSGTCPKPLPQARDPAPQPGTPIRPIAPIARQPVAKPALSKVSLLRTRFRAGSGATAVTAATAATAKRKSKRPRATPAGTAIRFTLSTRANLTFAIERRASGRKVKKSCRRATRKLRRKPVCTLWVKAATLTRRGLAAGRASVPFSGRIGRRALAPGSYRVTLKAANATGSSKPATLAFTVVRR